jgi:hypothetical protein
LHCSKTQNVFSSRSFASEFWPIMQIWTWWNWALKVLEQYLGPLYTRTQCWNRKKLFNLPQVTNKRWTLWPCIGPKAGKRIPSNLGGQFATLGTNVPAFINILTSMF